MENLDNIQEGIIQLVVLAQRGKHRKWYKKTLRRAIQYWTDERKHLFSAKALQLCNELGVDISKLTAYNTKKKTGGQLGKPNITLEHTTPINQLILTLLETKKKDMMTVLNNYSPCCFITQKENDRLNKNKFRNKRPGGWKKCYEICEIFLAE